MIRDHGVSTKTGHAVGITRVMDRRHNRYVERVVDKVTGEEIRVIDEPLWSTGVGGMPGDGLGLRRPDE